MNDDYYFSLKTRFIPGHRVDASETSAAFWFIFQGEKLLVNVADSGREDICSHSPEQLGIVPDFHAVSWQIRQHQLFRGGSRGHPGTSVLHAI